MEGEYKALDDDTRYKIPEKRFSYPFFYATISFVRKYHTGNEVTTGGIIHGNDDDAENTRGACGT